MEVARDALMNCEEEEMGDKVEHSLKVIGDKYPDSEWVEVVIKDSWIQEWSAIRRSGKAKEKRGGGQSDKTVEEEEDRVVVKQMEAKYDDDRCPWTVLVWRIPRSLITEEESSKKTNRGRTV